MTIRPVKPHLRRAADENDGSGHINSGMVAGLPDVRF